MTNELIWKIFLVKKNHMKFGKWGKTWIFQEIVLNNFNLDKKWDLNLMNSNYYRVPTDKIKTP